MEVYNDYEEALSYWYIRQRVQNVDRYLRKNDDGNYTWDYRKATLLRTKAEATELAAQWNGIVEIFPMFEVWDDTIND